MSDEPEEQEVLLDVGAVMARLASFAEADRAGPDDPVLVRHARAHERAQLSKRLGELGYGIRPGPPTPMRRARLGGGQPIRCARDGCNEWIAVLTPEGLRTHDGYGDRLVSSCRSPSCTSGGCSPPDADAAGSSTNSTPPANSSTSTD